MNFKQLILEIRKHMSMQQIANEAGVSLSCIKDIVYSSSHDPRWTTGNEIINLHKKICK
jgi:hypothetical protein